MSQANRSICDPAQRCICGGKAHATASSHKTGVRAIVECSVCGTSTWYYDSSELACAAWDRGDRLTQREFSDKVDAILKKPIGAKS